MIKLSHTFERLSNGTTVLIEEVPTVRSVSIGILVGFGTKYEAPKQGGIAHFIEHMLFKGTIKRSAADIAEQIDAVGGRINAHTGKEYTSYYAIVIDDHIDLAIDVLADMYLNSTFNEQEIERERNVILEEIGMYEDTPDEKIHDLSSQNIWDGHALGNPILGTIGSVKKITRTMMVNCMKEYYTPDNTIISIAGNVDAKKILALVKAKFETTRGKKKAYTEEPTRIIPGIKIVKKDTEQVHICLSAKGVSYKENDRFAMSILSSVLGGSMSSRLFQKVREQKGLVYSIYTYPTFYVNAGLFTLYVGTNIKNAQAVMDISLNEMKSIKNEGITAEELLRAKEQLKGHMVLNMEDTSSRMSWLLKSKFYYDEVQELETVMAKIDAVTLDDVQRVANQFFIKEDLQLTAIGKFPKTNYFKEIDC